MKNNLFFLAYILLGYSISANAQNILEVLDKEYPDTPQYEIATFKATRIAIGHSIENRKEGTLQLVTMNRYWNLPESKVQSFIADKWSARLAAEYGISDRLTTGVGWSTLENAFDGFLKYNLFRQRKDHKNSVSVSFFQNASYKNKFHNTPYENNNSDISFENRFTFTSQVLIAHKFTPEFSAQISPTFIHRTTPTLEKDPHNHFAMGFGGRYRIAPHVSIVSEYYYNANPLKSKDTYGAFALGINWDVRYLLLQFHMTNARGMVEDDFILQTPNNFNSQDGNFVFGFNAIFTLHLKKKAL